VNSDKLMFLRHVMMDMPNGCVTKREIWSHSSKNFDPLGIFSPVTVRAKMLMQLLWERKFNGTNIYHKAYSQRGVL